MPPKPPVHFTESVEPVSISRPHAQQATPPPTPSVSTPRPGATVTVTCTCSQQFVVTMPAPPAKPRKARWRLDADGLVLWGNVDRRIFDRDISSRAIPWHLVHPDDLARAQRAWQAAFARRVGFSMRIRVRLDAGMYIQVLHRGDPTFSENGEFTGYAGTTEPMPHD